MAMLAPVAVADSVALATNIPPLPVGEGGSGLIPTPATPVRVVTSRRIRLNEVQRAHLIRFGDGNETDIFQRGRSKRSSSALYGRGLLSIVETNEKTGSHTYVLTKEGWEFYHGLKQGSISMQEWFHTNIDVDGNTDINSSGGVGDGIKACTRCRFFKLFADFTSDNQIRDGHSSSCKECNSSGARERYAVQRTETVEAPCNQTAVERLSLTADDIALLQAFLAPGIDSTEAAAAHIGFTPKNAKFRLGSIYAKFGAQNLIQALRIYRGALREDSAFIPAPLGDAKMLDALTIKERSVLQMIADGETNDKIGVALEIASSSVGICVSNILAKLGVSKRYQAAMIHDDQALELRSVPDAT